MSNDASASLSAMSAITSLESYRWMRESQQRYITPSAAKQQVDQLVNEEYHTEECARLIAYKMQECICRKGAGTSPLRSV